MPQPVIHGMLAAIGVIIVAKQIHVMLGVTPHSKSPLGLLAEIPTSIRHLNPEVLFVGALTLLIVVVMPLIPILALKKIPAALIALAVTIPLALWWHLDSKFFVLVPADFLGSFTLPDFDILKTWAAWKYVAMFALIGSLESLLTVTAIDSLDPDKGQSNLDADLRSVGIGNLIASMIGGLPMISEVVRSKANMDAGAKSSWSNFFHGFYLLVAISLFAPEIDLIPLESLAAMLIAIGYRLASPREFYKMYQEGFDHLFVFIATLIITLKTDLLVGVCSGVVLHILIQKVLAVRSQVAK
jgi:MFS superfamily sulfate permease-like transporter